MMKIIKSLQWSLFFFGILFLGSCKRQKTAGYHDLNKKIIPGKYSTREVVEKQKKITKEWWKEFKNESLNQLIDKALKNNFNIKTAHSRLSQSLAIAKAGGSSRYPQLNANVTRSRTSTRTSGGNVTDSRGIPIPSSDINRIAVGLSLSYEIDFLGRIKNQVEALDYEVLSTQEDISIAIISIASQITNTWFRLYNLSRQKENLEQQLALQKKDTQFVRTQVRNGQVPVRTLWQKQQAELVTSSDLLQIKGDIKVLENSMSVLTGFPPGNYQYTFIKNSFSIPAQPNIGIPLELIQQRPDIRKAYYSLLAADKRIAAAIKDRYPKLSLSASAESSEEKVSKLFKNWLISLAGNLLAPLIDGGRRKAEVQKQKATYQILLNNYGKTVINAIKEVEDALILEETRIGIQKANVKQVTLTDKMKELARNSYRANQIDLSAYYQAQINCFSANRRLLASESQLLDARINLYKALANTWAPTTKKNQQKEK